MRSPTLNLSTCRCWIRRSPGPPTARRCVNVLSDHEARGTTRGLRHGPDHISLYVLALLDERSYKPRTKMLALGSGRDMRMGADHPVVWQHRVGKGRALYSALGHPA
ncbi:ThuA domain-containing protein [Novosphingobium sp. Chol11]|uniref:ThuA domain-containing protein n=1 Tax=Novosphingobium sp. Chol11 TaxID=1385763 RepID=UPI0034E95E91